jgi:formylglycine-generating enzyme required for sulfatase activity
MAKKAAEPTQRGSILEGLIDLREEDPLFNTMSERTPPAAASHPSQQVLRAWSAAVEKLSWLGPRRWWAAAGALLLGLMIAWVVVTRVRSTNGMIVLKPMPKNAVVEVDGGGPPETESKSRVAVAPEPSSDSITNSIGMKLTLIPAGEFIMGSPDSDPEALADEKPRHRVQITKPFYLGVYEVTCGQFRRFVDETGYRTDAEEDGKGGWGWNEEKKSFEKDAKYNWRNSGFEQTDDHPVGNVSWNDAVAFCAWLSRAEVLTYRLPTEAEWEYACRARTTAKYFSGDDPVSPAMIGNVADATGKEKYPDWSWAIAAQDGFVNTAPVGQFRPNAFGLYDMHGNVWEWCQDAYEADYYRQSPGVDPSGLPQAAQRVDRGGCFSSAPGDCRSANREGHTPGDRYSGLGFRVARDQTVAGTRG